MSVRKIYAVLLLCAGIWFECAAQCGNVGTITGPAQVCVGSGITLADTSAEGAWRSSNAAIATVNTSGMVTGVAVGSDSIIYTNVCGTDSVAYFIMVNALPVINPVANQTVCTGNATNEVTFSGTPLTVYNWTNSNPAIGLATSGTGGVPSFISINAGTTPVVATITATPVESEGFAYIANSGADSVSVINTNTNTVVASVIVGYAPGGIAVNPAGSYAYVANYDVASVSVVSQVTHTVTGTINTGGAPVGIAVSPDGSKVYTGNADNGHVWVINTATNTVTDSVRVGAYPAGIVVSPDGNKVYAVINSSGTNGAVAVVNTATNTLIDTIAVGSYPSGIAASADGTRVYVTNYGSNSVSAISTANDSVIATILSPLIKLPGGIAVSPDGSKVYVVSIDINAIAVINTTTNIVIDTIAVGDNPEGVALTYDGSFAYVSNYYSNNTSVINTATHAVINTVPVGKHPSTVGNYVSSGDGCTGEAVTFTITINPVLYDSINRSICQGDSFYLDNRTYTLPGDYTDTLTNISGCDSVITLKLTVNRLPVVSFSLEPLYQENDLSFYGGIVWCEDNVNPSNFALTGGGPVGGYYAGNTVHNDTFYAQFSSSLADTVTYYYTDTNNCANSAYSIIKDVICEGITTIPAANLFTLYPNPADDYVMINFDAAYTSGTVFIKDITGRQLFETQLTTGPQQIPTGNLPPGVYLVTLYKNGQLGARLMVKE